MPFGFRRYFKGWGSRFIRELDDLSSTISDTGRGDTRRPAYSNRKSQARTYDEIKQECAESGALWEDPDFPAADSSLFHTNPPSIYPDIEWLRPHEIADDPQMFTDGASRLDVNQGVLGDCWFLAAVAALSQNERLLHRVVPNQSFSEDYCGMFKFNFWQFGRWVEVLIDDRLPCSNGKLIYMHSDSTNEFWTALVEKAYAKMYGCYENLSGGLTSEAMVDFTGGVVERFVLRDETPEDLLPHMLKAKKRFSLMGCSIDASPDQLEAQLDNGLVIGHAYTVTDVRLVEVDVPSFQGEMPLVRCRNPWGNECEWNGPWSDKSEEWQFIPEEERESMGLTFSHDGEFWMSFEDFTKEFQRLEICFLGPDTLIAGDDGEVADDIQRWESTAENGSWRRRVNAGGCPNYPQTFWTNPQYRVTVNEVAEDDEDGLGLVIIGLMQKGRRKMRTEGKDNVTMGYMVYQLEDDISGNLPPRFFSQNRSIARSPNFINMREVSSHHKLAPGNYVVVPSTFEPGEEADFLLRVFTEKQAESKEIDDATSVSGPTEDDPAPEVESDEDKRNATEEEFREKAGSDRELDAYELLEILNGAFGGSIAGFDGFNIEACRSMVSMRDADFTGKLGINEFHELYKDIETWEAVFKQFDTDESGHFNSYELRRALNTIARVHGLDGLRLSNSAFNAMVMRYSNRDGHVSFEDFISCVIKLKLMFETFKLKEEECGGDGQATFNMDEFIAMTMYS